MTILFLFLALQFADLATTLVFLRHGVAEANPLVLRAIALLSSPALGVACVKLGGCGLGFYCWRSRRTRLLRCANVFFAGCVAWNVLVLTR